VGKLPADLLARLVSRAPIVDPRVRLPPGPGLDCAVLDLGDRLLAIKSDPITFATDEIGWYLVQVNANDLATCGAQPRWLMLTMLLPGTATTPALVEEVSAQVFEACRALGISVIGGHTEITYGLDRPLLSGTMIGEIEPGRLVTPQGVAPGDRLLLTKGVPIEATAILAREFAARLSGTLTAQELDEARNFLHRPGISVLRDAQVALATGRVNAMHDPTEGGLVGALWELADACGHTLVFDPRLVPVPPLASRICSALGIDPLASIASGALLLAVPADEAAATCRALAAAGIVCAEIGRVETGQPEVRVEAGATAGLLARPKRDEIARLFDSTG
jgi:hydrogenase expression/formation protein HypE